MSEIQQDKRVRYHLGDVTLNRYCQLPWFLFLDEFEGINNDARVLYAVLRDRHDLSMKNQWVNENGEVYILFSREEMCKLLGVSENTILKTMKILKEKKLIEEERQGFGKPNRIYVLTAGTVENTDSRIFCGTTSADFAVRFPQDLPPSQLTDLTYINHTESHSQSQTELPNILSENICSRIEKEDSNEKPDKTMTPDDDMTSRVLVVNDEEAKKKPPPFTPVSEIYRQAEAPKKYTADDYTTYTELIKSNIDFESFSDPDDRKLADSLVGTMLDVILTKSPDTVKIGKETKSRDIVRSVYLKLNHGHIAHVMTQYRVQFRRIIFKGAYLRTMLFNTYTELEAASVNKRSVADSPEQERQLQQPPVKEAPQKKNRFINFDQREIDFDELERLELEQLMSSMRD